MHLYTAAKQEENYDLLKAFNNELTQRKFTLEKIQTVFQGPMIAVQLN